MTAKKTPAKPAKKAARAAKAAKPSASAAKPAAFKKASPKPPGQKPQSKPAKSAAKAQPATKAAPKNKPMPASKAAPKPGAGKPASVGKAGATPKGKTTAAAKQAAKGNAAPVKEAPRKKLNVGQKPRSEKADLPLKPQNLASAARGSGPDPAGAPKASPASKEAKQTFRVSDFVVYPAHGVGRIVGIEKQHIAGVTNELFVIDFEQEKMKLRVPTAKAISVGMRGLADDGQVKKAVEVLKGRARIKRTMWSRRAQEYEAKINSGDIMAVAEVVRDLYRATDQPEQSYSERQLFEAALDRLAREVAAVRKTDLGNALAELDASLQLKKAA